MKEAKSSPDSSIQLHRGSVSVGAVDGLRRRRDGSMENESDGCKVREESVGEDGLDEILLVRDGCSNMANGRKFESKDVDFDGGLKEETVH